MPLEKLSILLLYVSRVRQHHRTQVPGGWGCPHHFRIALSGQIRHTSGMIDVGMGQYQGVDLLDRKRELGILPVGLGPTSLEQSAIQNNGTVTHFQQMARPRDFASGATERDPHFTIPDRSDAGRPPSDVRRPARSLPAPIPTDCVRSADQSGCLRRLARVASGAR